MPHLLRPFQRLLVVDATAEVPDHLQKHLQQGLSACHHVSMSHVYLAMLPLGVWRFSGGSPQRQKSTLRKASSIPCNKPSVSLSTTSLPASKICSSCKRLATCCLHGDPQPMRMAPAVKVQVAATTLSGQLACCKSSAMVEQWKSIADRGMSARRMLPSSPTSTGPIWMPSQAFSRLIVYHTLDRACSGWNTKYAKRFQCLCHHDRGTRSSLHRTASAVPLAG